MESLTGAAEAGGLRRKAHEDQGKKYYGRLGRDYLAILSLLRCYFLADAMRPHCEKKEEML